MTASLDRIGEAFAHASAGRERQDRHHAEHSNWRFSFGDAHVVASSLQLRIRRHDGGLGAAAGAGVGEGLADPVQGEAAAEPLEAQLRQQRGAAERGAAPIGAVDADLAEVRVCRRDRAAGGSPWIDADELDSSGRRQAARPGRPAPAPPPPHRPRRGRGPSWASRSRSSRFSRVDRWPRARPACAMARRSSRGSRGSATGSPFRAMAMVVGPMMPPPITSTVASRGIRYISSPEGRPAGGGLRRRRGDGIDRGEGCVHESGSATRSAKPPTRVARGRWEIRPFAQAAHWPQP